MTTGTADAPARSLSLRARLTLIILGPLLVIAALIGTWAVIDAQDRAAARFDRSLLSAVLAISRDVVLSGGDALSPGTGALLRDTSGGRLFYHVYAPDGVFVTGYATPPVPPGPVRADPAQQIYFDATYLSRPVRVLRFQDAMQVEGLTGVFTFTVWQDTRLRRAIVRDLSTRTFIVMASLTLALALIVWFGVRLGLSPLTDLESAIARRSSEDLTPIRRRVPGEVSGIVARLNSLLGQVEATMQAKDTFISNAAHQLRNPIAGMLAMSEAMGSARSFSDMKARSADLVTAARQASGLANRLLAFERARAAPHQSDMARADLVAVVRDAVAGQETVCAQRGARLRFHSDCKVLDMRCDPVMIAETVTNLIDNALVHGGAGLSAIRVGLWRDGDRVVLAVADDGRGLARRDIARALERFGQVETSGGSGLGLAIAAAVARGHGGELSVEPGEAGLVVRLTLAVV